MPDKFTLCNARRFYLSVVEYCQYLLMSLINRHWLAMCHTLVVTAYPLPVGSNFVLGEMISQGRLLGNYIPLKLHRLSLVYNLFFLGGGLKTRDPRLLRPCYQRQTILLVRNGLISRHPNLKFLRFLLFLIVDISASIPPPLKRKAPL
jgi:hypothetical protein